LLLPLFRDLFGRIRVGIFFLQNKICPFLAHGLARSFNLTFRYIDDVLSLNNYRFGDVVDRIYPIELEIKDTTYTDISASYLDLHFEIDSEGWLRTKLCGTYPWSFVTQTQNCQPSRGSDRKTSEVMIST
jgi:hypothetical protein